MNERVGQGGSAAANVAAQSSRFGRLRDAIADHNWFSVAIEILIVTVGILLAFQIDQWGDQRKQAGEERQFLERLYRENLSSAAELRQVLEVHEDTVREVGSAIRARGQSEIVATYSRQQDFGCGLASFPPATYNDTAFEELLASGRINLISDAELRFAVRELAASQAQGAAQVAYGRQQLLYTLPALDPYQLISVDDRNLPVCFIDWTGVVQDRKALTAASRLLRRHVMISSARKETLALNERLERSLACKLNKPECRQ